MYLRVLNKLIIYHHKLLILTKWSVRHYLDIYIIFPIVIQLQLLVVSNLVRYVNFFAGLPVKINKKIQLKSTSTHYIQIIFRIFSQRVPTGNRKYYSVFVCVRVCETLKKAYQNDQNVVVERLSGFKLSRNFSKQMYYNCTSFLSVFTLQVRTNYK